MKILMIKPSRILMYTLIILALMLASVLLATSCRNNAKKSGDLRDYPGNYSAMLAVCSDIDGTTLREFELVHRFLNTKEQTELGTGLGLDIADSFWMYTFNNDDVIHDYLGNSHKAIMAYFWKDGVIKNGHAISKYFQCGWIDTIHSFGDFSMLDESETEFTAELAQYAAKTMYENNLRPTVWINHGNASNVQNFSGGSKKSSLSYQHGSDPASEYYHADISIPLGIKYIWFSDTSNKFGTKTPLYAVTLQDGQKVWGFRRYTGENNGFLFKHQYNWSIFDLDKQFTTKKLDTLVKKRNVAIVSQHFGGGNYEKPFMTDGTDALRLLASYQENGEILIARTSRLLEYIRIRDNLVYEYSVEGGTEVIDIKSIADPVLGNSTPAAGDLKGITFFVENSDTAIVSINGEPVPSDLLQKGAEVDRQTVGFLWYEPDYTDYTKK